MLKLYLVLHKPNLVLYKRYLIPFKRFLMLFKHFLITFKHFSLYHLKCAAFFNSVLLCLRGQTSFLSFAAKYSCHVLST